jgi:hypothetical protein
LPCDCFSDHLNRLRYLAPRVSQCTNVKCQIELPRHMMIDCARYMKKCAIVLGGTKLRIGISINDTANTFVIQMVLFVDPSLLSLISYNGERTSDSKPVEPAQSNRFQNKPRKVYDDAPISQCSSECPFTCFFARINKRYAAHPIFKIQLILQHCDIFLVDSTTPHLICLCQDILHLLFIQFQLLLQFTPFHIIVREL